MGKQKYKTSATMTELPLRRSPRLLHQIATPIRRSRRLLHQNPQYLPTAHPKPSKILRNSTQKPSNGPKKASTRASLPPTKTFDSEEGIPNLRRCSRLSKQIGEIRSKKLRHSASIVESKDNDGLVRGVVVGLQAVNRRDVCERNEETRKRKREDEGKKESVKGWTKEQEMALERAYIVVKPTPNFWKEVAKMVPGKSAKDCFDRVHFDYKTPPRPREKKVNSSPLRCVSLSASKLLGSSSVKVEKLRCNKQKSHIAHKTVRYLLQKHNRLGMNYEADLFSVFEPNENPSGPDSELNNVVSAPKQLHQKQGFQQNFHENSSEIDSPPVLKPVKNRALHEKYIDQLHRREAKRKSACTAGKENKSQNIPETDMVRTAKNALVDAINTLQHLQKKPKEDSSDSDDLNMDDDESDGL